MPSQEDESQPLLPPPSPSSPSHPTPFWNFWRRISFPHPLNRVSLSTDEADQEVRNMYQNRTDRLVRIFSYILILLVGLCIGALLPRIPWRSRDVGDEPMVPPIYTLPPPTGLPRNPAYLINATTAAVASEDLTCSQLGVSILRDKNGTAVDAAITTTLCIGLLNGFASGIGGGGFLVLRAPEGTSRDVEVWKGLEEVKEGGVVAVDFRETSPEKVEREMYGISKAGRVAAQVGGLAVGVPGELRGLEAAHQLYGSLSWEELVMPVAEIAEKGWQVSRELARRLRLFGQFMLDSPTWSEIYAPRGYLLVEGEFIQRKAYARTLKRIAQEGPGAFYEGDIAKSTVKTIGSHGGVMTLRDLADYKARSSPAISQTWRGKQIYTTDAPSSGGVMLGLLNILEPFESEQCWDELAVHRLIEAQRFAFGARSEVTDPTFAHNLTRLAEFRTKEWANIARSKLTNQTHDMDYYGLQHGTPVDYGTTHLSVVDQWGGAASVTSTVNLIWGSHVMDSETGIIFNDEQDDFAIPGAPDAFGLWPSPWNYPAPGKKPLSSTSPTIILQNSSLWGVFGGSGGSRIFPSVAQVLLNLECGDDLSTAIERPRWHNQVVPSITTLEVGPEGEDRDLIKALEKRGHEIGLYDINVGASEVQGIVVVNGTVFASSDSRKNGIAAGY
ncbi:gamma-glutamyltransferase [Tremella mesenterica]|uniref:Glutathione hydrolase n=1 Tax=Tremella mesenterica TaxID=5217 RepID=A0A4Q1BVQ6_TREME|nr:gamma-glutamyltransferase [Tremella mesenterica]